ncbi:MAG: membrane protein insertase YidC, partial [Shinella sp.]
MENNRNYFVAIAMSVVILIAWQFLYVNPKLEKDRVALEAQQAQIQQTTTTAGGTTTTATGTSGTLPGGAATGTTTETREAALARSARVEIDTPSLSGSINLTGARFDDLKLKGFHETVDKTSPIITLLSPAETEHGYFAEIGYVGSDATGQVPNPQTVWVQEGTGKLTQTTPVKLTFTNDKGITFTRTISVDEHYMFTVADSIENRTDAAIALSPYGRATRFFKPKDPSVYVLHEGFIGVLGALGLHEVKYTTTEEDTTVAPGKATGGWLGITDKYWATALVPPQATPYETRFSYFTDGRPRYQADYRQDDITIAPGQKADVKNLFFGGAKEVPIIDQYETSYS